MPFDTSIRTMIGMTAAALALGAAPSRVGAQAPQVTITRLDCGTITIKDFNAFFSDTLELPSGARKITDSCYVIRHKGDVLLWDTGFGASLKGKTVDMGSLVARLDLDLAEQLARLGIAPAQVTVVGISHQHADHTGGAKDFPGAKLLIGKSDFENTKGKDDPFLAWRSDGAKVEVMHGADIDVFGDGSVIALNLPGHTGDHMALLVKLASGNVMLSGDLYHSDLSRQFKTVPPFNASRADTLASIDRFERLAKHYRAKVVIQHEPADIPLLPAFPASAR